MSKSNSLEFLHLSYLSEYGKISIITSQTAWLNNDECALPKVHYVSDRETTSATDKIVFETEFVSSSPSTLPRRFARRHRFVFPISVEPAERHETDGGGGAAEAGLLPEILDSSKSKPIRLVEGTKRQLG